MLIIHIAKKRSYNPDGTLYPLMLILYGGTRFIWEFFADNDKLFLRISELALWALLTFLIGVVWYVTVKEANRKKKPEKAHR